MTSSEENPRQGSASEPTWFDLIQQLMENRSFQLCALLSSIVLGIAGLFAAELTTNARILITAFVAFALFLVLPSPLKRKFWYVGHNVSRFIQLLIIGFVVLFAPAIITNYLWRFVTGLYIDAWIYTLHLPVFLKNMLDGIVPLVAIGGTLLFWVAVFHVYNLIKRGVDGEK